MGQIPFNKVFEKQNKKLVRATFKKAVISSVNVSANTANVYFAENPQTVIQNIPLASHITASKLNAGDRCRVDVFDETNPNDMVVAYIYGRTIPAPNKVIFNYGTGSMSNGGSNSLTIAHGLKDSSGNGVTPDVWFVVTNPAAVYYSVSGRYYTLFNNSADATNLNATRDPDNTISISYIWFAMKFNQ